jgi:hypothetical protein
MGTLLTALTSFFFLALAAPALAEAPTDSAIRQILIEESIARYSGNCPCPENRASNGSRCGKRSAWHQVGGAAPLCYPSDVTDADVAAYRAKHGGVGIQDVKAGKRSSQAEETTKQVVTSYSTPPVSYDPTIPPSTPATTIPPSIKQSVQQLPDCQPGTTLARTNNQYICVETPETLATVVEPVSPKKPVSGANTERSITFADVLSKLQADASASGQPVPMPTETSLAPPAMGLLNCRGETRVTHVDGRIECR